jgi:hypothetical protein
MITSTPKASITVTPLLMSLNVNEHHSFVAVKDLFKKLCSKAFFSFAMMFFS